MKSKLQAIRNWFNRALKRGPYCPKQQEINRLRAVLHDIADSRPDALMDIEKNPELVNWICDTCWNARRSIYPGAGRA